jgi:hypothetical protein
MKRALGMAAALALWLGAAGPTNAGQVTYDLTWTKTGIFGVDASATATITFDPTALPTPTDNEIPLQSIPGLDFSLSVFFPNQTDQYTADDFSVIALDINPNSVPIVFTQQLVGQSGFAGLELTPFSSAAPTGSGYNLDGQNEAFTYFLSLTSFAPQTAPAAPEPSTLALFGTAALSVAGYLGWRRKRAGVPRVSPASISPVQQTGPASISPVQNTGLGRA